MKIRKLEQPYLVTFQELRVGKTFMSGGYMYVKLNNGYPNNAALADCATIVCFGDHQEVTPVQIVEAVIRETEN